MNEVVRLRRELHQCAELSGQERETAARVMAFFEPLGPDQVYSNLGGHGLAFVFAGADPGLTVLLRCDLDALPIREVNDFPHVSMSSGVSHKCGHDGHMAIMAAVGVKLAGRRPARGRAVLLFQPAEENGQGARAVIEDPRFGKIRPDHVFALHNLPGFAMGEVLVREGTFCCASSGVVIELEGSTGHAAQPETGRNPAGAMCGIMEALENLGGPSGVAEEISFATVVGARLGVDDCFGTTPGAARIMATIRAETDESLTRLASRVESTVAGIAENEGLSWDLTYRDEFPATVNAPDAVATIRRTATSGTVKDMASPFHWSEDFGYFTGLTNGALFGLGAGVETPALHHPAYDFPDELIQSGAALLRNILEDYLG